MRTIKLLCLLVVIATALVACAQTQLAVHAARQLIGEPPPPVEGSYKVGNPYEINGIWYTPKVDPNYDATGIASWYGRDFHGRLTANGEVYDMYAVSAAHTTLPLPTWVRVTNLDNGRSLELRINDRGPFVDNRIIDVSFRAAQLLGFSEQGLARTRVQVLRGPAGAVAEVGQPRPGVPDAVAPVARRAGVPRLALLDPPPSVLYVQAGAFDSSEAANRLRRELEPLGRVTVTAIDAGNRRFHLVRVGPLASVRIADETLQLVHARGHPEARIVVE